MRKLECILLPRGRERGIEESLAAGVAWEAACGESRQYLFPRTTVKRKRRSGREQKGKDTLNVAISWYLPLNRNISTEICDLEQSIANVL